MLDDLVLCGTLIFFPFIIIFLYIVGLYQCIPLQTKSLIKQQKSPFDLSLTNISVIFCTYLCECRRESLNNSAA